MDIGSHRNIYVYLYKKFLNSSLYPQILCHFVKFSVALQPPQHIINLLRLAVLEDVKWNLTQGFLTIADGEYLCFCSSAILLFP